MPKSKNRPNHKQKLQARRNRINETTNIKKKQMKQWIQQMQETILKQQNDQQNVIDVNAATPIAQPVVEEISQEPPTELGASGELK